MENQLKPVLCGIIGIGALLLMFFYFVSAPLIQRTSSYEKALYEDFDKEHNESYVYKGSIADIDLTKWYPVKR